MIEPVTVWIIGGIAIVYYLRLELVNVHTTWVVEYLKKVCLEYAKKEKNKALRGAQDLPEDEKVHQEYLDAYTERLSVLGDVWEVFYKYPSRYNLAFDLTKWSRDDMFPYIIMNTALALDGKKDEIDYDLIK